MLLLYYIYKDKLKEEFPELQDEIIYDIIHYHDVVYEVTSDCNEEKSVQKYLDDGGREKEVIEAILSTKIDNENYESHYEKVIHDLDYGVFRDYIELCESEKKIYNEIMDNSDYTKEECIKGRLEFYKNLLKKNVFQTKTFSIFNEVANMNIQSRIKEMEEK